jgi:hypothetical protein
MTTDWKKDNDYKIDKKYGIACLLLNILNLEKILKLLSESGIRTGKSSLRIVQGFQF